MTSDPHFSIRIIDHRTRERLVVELLDLPFGDRKYAVRVNGRKPSRIPYATKTQVWDRLRKWMVKRG